ncbi:MAG: cell division protein FtsA [Rhodobacteraceae bacterium]|nr:cell division protein FtsA [Paracoccaceae bacterium]
MTIFPMQRAMRNLCKSAIKRGVLAILDVGSAKISCLVLRFPHATEPLDRADDTPALPRANHFEVIAVATTRAQGVRLGEISAMREAEGAIRTAVQKAQQKAQTPIDHVIACFSGGNPLSYGVSGVIALEDHIVDHGHIAKVLNACLLPDYGSEREVLHAQPVNFTLDGRSGLVDPRGQRGQHLGVDMHLLTIDAAAVQNLALCIARCDLELAGIVNSPYAAAMASLVEDEQQLGAACIDMGAGSTGVAIFLHGHMIHADSVRLGGMHLSNDISMGLQVPIRLAERIKNLHGGVHATSHDDHEMIPLAGESGDWQHDTRCASRAEVIAIMRPRVEEIFEELRKPLEMAQFDKLPSRQIVLTGGGSQTPGLGELASRVLGQQVRLGSPMRVPKLPQDATGPEYSSLVGTCLYAAHLQDEWWDFDQPDAALSAHPLRRIGRLLRGIW